MDATRTPAHRVILAGVVHFALVFLVGFVLGTVRVLWLVDWVGVRAAELAEAPVMLLATFISARLVVRWFGLTGARGRALLAGLLALALLVGCELTVVLGLRGLTLDAYLQGRDAVAFPVYVALLILFAIMPALVARRAGPPAST